MIRVVGLVNRTDSEPPIEKNVEFIEGTPDDLPPARREKYEQSRRNSRVLVKKLDTSASASASARQDAINL